MEIFALLGILFSIAMAILWLVIGWRAMVAHEAIARAVSRYVAREEVDRSAEIRADSISNTKLYKRFIDGDPSRAELPAKDRHEAFRKWSATHLGDEEA